MTIADVYLIHDNGGRPYKCVVSGACTRVHKLARYQENDEPIYRKDPLHILEGTPWIGKDPFDSDVDGNSILVVHTDGSVTYIGSTVYRFQPRSPITTFVSPIGNNDVPYPYALDQHSNYYFFAENIVVNPGHIVNQDEPYSHDGGLYGLMNMTGFEGIVQYKALGEFGGPYNMTWRPRTGNQFRMYDHNDRYIGNAEYVVVEKSGGVREHMTRIMLQQLYNRFAAVHGLAAIGAVPQQ